jgi:hypothetical protein
MSAAADGVSQSKCFYKGAFYTRQLHACSANGKISQSTKAAQNSIKIRHLKGL